MSASPRATVRHAIIPCLNQIELLPVGGVPILEWIVRECAASGTSELLIVTPTDLDSIRSLIAPRVGSPGFPLRITFSETAPTFADVLAHGHAFAGDAPLGLAMPANLFIGDAPGLSQVVETYYRTGKNVAGVVGHFATDEVDLRSAIDHVVGRYLIAPRAWAVIGGRADVDEARMIEALLDAHCIIGRRMRGQFLDVGRPEGRADATRVTIRPPRPSAPTGRIDE
jgi:UTP-glucose-1-phosphate uridylyltransferase